MKRIALFLLTNIAVLAVINITLRILGVDRVLDQSVLPEKIAAFGISGGSSFSRLFMAHPPLDERIAALRAGV